MPCSWHLRPIFSYRISWTDLFPDHSADLTSLISSSNSSFHPMEWSLLVPSLCAELCLILSCRIGKILLQRNDYLLSSSRIFFLKKKNCFYHYPLELFLMLSCRIRKILVHCNDYTYCHLRGLSFIIFAFFLTFVICDSQKFYWTRCLTPSCPTGTFVDFTLSNARRLFSSMGNPSGRKGLKRD